MDIVIDADGLVAGRLASLAAKELLKGSNVNIINAEKAVVEMAERRSMTRRPSTEYSPQSATAPTTTRSPRFRCKPAESAPGLPKSRMAIPASPASAPAIWRRLIGSRMRRVASSPVIKGPKPLIKVAFTAVV